PRLPEGRTLRSVVLYVHLPDRRADSAWSLVLLGPTPRGYVCSRRERVFTNGYWHHQEGHLRPRLRLHQRRGWQGVLLPQGRTDELARVRPPHRWRDGQLRRPEWTEGRSRRSRRGRLGSAPGSIDPLARSPDRAFFVPDFRWYTSCPTR